MPRSQIKKSGKGDTGVRVCENGTRRSKTRLFESSSVRVR